MPGSRPKVASRRLDCNLQSFGSRSAFLVGLADQSDKAVFSLGSHTCCRVTRPGTLIEGKV